MSASLAIGTVNSLEVELARVHDLIPTLADDELIAAYRAADELGNRAWLIQAHCLWEANRRQEHRKDTNDKFALCRTFELGAKRASEMIQAWQHFGSSSGYPDELPLPKNFYIEALRSDDPAAAIAKAEDRKAVDPGYGVHDFRRDIRVEKAQQQRATPMGLSESQVIEKIRVPAATAMRRLLAASEAVRPIARYLPERVALVVCEDDGWPAVVRLAEWIMRVEAARTERQDTAAD